MNDDQQRSKAAAFLAMHTAPELLVLPNAWDVISAKILEDHGFKAIATTSAGVAATIGYADGQRMSLEENLDVARRMAKCVDLPVSVDLEAGYASTPEGVAKSASAVWDAGAIGFNLEDGTGDPRSPLLDQVDMEQRIRAVRELATSRNQPLVVNARTDVFLEGDAPIPDRLRSAIERGNAYVRAGADCIFVPDTGTLNKAVIADLVRDIEAPLNIIAGGHIPPLAELEDIGVSRVSFGPRPHRATLALFKTILQELSETGTYEHMSQDTLSYADVNELCEPGFAGTCGSDRTDGKD